MILKIALATLVLSPVLANATCNNPVDSSKVVFFIDTNNNPREIETAQQAACDRGEVFVTVPSEEEKQQAIEINEQISNQYQAMSTNNCGSDPSKAECREIEQNLASLEERRSQVGAYKENVKKKIDELAAQGKTVSSLIASGHDGGGNFGGHTGQISKEELKDIFAAHPNLRDNVGSILLLGCYTGVPGEMEKWKQYFPKTKLIGGYEGSAPLGDKPAGHSYLREMLIKEKTILEAADEDELKRILRGITHINYIHASVYADINRCDVSLESNTKDYLYQPLIDDRSLRWHEFEPTGAGNSVRCTNARDRVYQMVEEYHNYFSGSTPVPTHTGAGSRMLTIYAFARNYQECFRNEFFNNQSFPDAEEVLMLRFFHQMKMNFADYFESDINEIDQLVDEIKANDGASILASLNEQLAPVQKKYNSLKDILDNFDERKYVFRKQKMKELLDSIKDQEASIQSRIEQVTDPQLKGLLEKFLNGQDISDSEYQQLLNASEDVMNTFSSISSLMYSKGQVEYYNNIGDNGLKSMLLNEINYAEYSVNALEKDIADFPDKVRKIKESYKSLKKSNIENMTRAQVNEQAHIIEELAILTKYHPKGAKVKKFQNNVNTNLYNLRCLPFEWHEYPRPEGTILREPTCNGGSFGESFIGGFGGIGGGFGQSAPMQPMGSYPGGGMMGGMMGGYPSVDSDPAPAPEEDSNGADTEQ